jgi:hypothetical protein
MATPSHYTSFVVDPHAATPLEARGRYPRPSALANMRGSAEPLHQLVNLVLATSVSLGSHLGFAPFRNGNWRVFDTTPPSV